MLATMQDGQTREGQTKNGRPRKGRHNAGLAKAEEEEEHTTTEAQVDGQAKAAMEAGAATQLGAGVGELAATETAETAAAPAEPVPQVRRQHHSIVKAQTRHSEKEWQQNWQKMWNTKRDRTKPTPTETKPTEANTEPTATETAETAAAPADTVP